jgi:hypothetical protein
MKFILALLLVLTSSSFASTPTVVDPRYCGTPVRDASGTIVRSSKVLRDFQTVHPCPSTGLQKGACPGWQMNHVIPLACGGCDVIWNLDWMPIDVKACSGAHCRDRYERKIYDAVPSYPGTDACTNTIVQ